MPGPVTREEFATPAGRRRAWRELVFVDHGFLRGVYDNAHEIAPGVYRSAQPGPKRLKTWRDRGVRTVLNLRGPRENGVLLLEEDACRSLGMAHLPFRVYSREAPTPEILRGAKALFDEIEPPFLMHCKSGADRVGLMATLYSFFALKRPLPDAMAHLSWRYGHVRFGKTGVIDAALTEYIDFARERGIPLDDAEAFLDWAGGPYDPAATKARFRSNWLGDLLTERILNRE
ncbi:MAG: protein tyrosine phosphatase [Alphaproteobacteria bacterium]|nr:protein tyrosine phosphatase [Alphaproteobacteria bacterium]